MAMGKEKLAQEALFSANIERHYKRMLNKLAKRFAEEAEKFVLDFFKKEQEDRIEKLKKQEV